MHAQTEANIETAATKITGSSQVAGRAGVQIYIVEVKDGDNLPLLDDFYLGLDDEVPVANGGVQILVCDLTTPKGLTAAYISAQCRPRSMFKGKPPITCRSQQCLGCFDDHAMGLENNDVVVGLWLRPKAIT